MSKASISVRDTWCLHTDRGQVVTRIVNCRLNDLCAFTRAFTTTITMASPLLEIEWPRWKGPRFTLQSCIFYRKKKHIIIDKILKSIPILKIALERFPLGEKRNQFFIRVVRKLSIEIGTSLNYIFFFYVFWRAETLATESKVSATEEISIEFRYTRDASQSCRVLSLYRRVVVSALTIATSRLSQKRPISRIGQSGINASQVWRIFFSQSRFINSSYTSFCEELANSRLIIRKVQLSYCSRDL